MDNTEIVSISLLYAKIQHTGVSALLYYNKIGATIIEGIGLDWIENSHEKI